MKRPAFTLTEVAVAMAIFAFAATLLFALLPLSIKQSKNSRHEINAMMLMERIEGDLRQTSSPGKTSELFDIPSPYDGETTKTYYFAQSQKLVNTPQEAYYRIDCILRHKKEESMTHLSLQAYWPAAAPKGREEGSAELFTYISDTIL